MGRFAVLLDGAFVVRRLQRMSVAGALGESARAIEASDIAALVDRIRAHARLRDHELIRAYFYDAPPLSGRKANPLGGQNYSFDGPVRLQNQRLHDQIRTQSDFALRLGEAVFRGWRLRKEILESSPPISRPLEPADISPHVEQKGVDLRIGLDMAALAFKRIADVVVLVTGDSDLVPAMKLVRREGLRVYLDCMGNPARPGLVEHADFVFEENLHASILGPDKVQPAPINPSR